MQTYRIVIRIFKATTELHTCLEYMQKHREVLSVYGIQMITSNNNRWVDNYGIYVIVAESMDTGEMMAGIRIQLAKGNQQLPIENATAELDPRVNDLVKRYDAQGATAEITALWNDRSYKGIGLSSLLISVSSAVLDQLQLTSILGLCDTRNVETMRANGGYVIETSIGENGYFYYPKQGLKAWAIALKDPATVSSADQEVRELIRELRKNPVQHKVLQRGNSILDLEFRLMLPADQLFKVPEERHAS